MTAAGGLAGLGRLLLALALGIVLSALGVVLGVLESFLHPVRVVGLPVGVVAAGLVNLAVAQLVGRGTRSRAYALVPLLTWLLTVIVLTLRRPEGDFVVSGTWIGYGYLAAGMAGGVLGVVLLPWYGPPARAEGSLPPDGRAGG